MKILCISPNITLEYSWTVPGLRLGGVYRAKEEVRLASGKGVNVARAIQILGGEALCMGFIAGHTGRLIEDLAASEGLVADWTWVEGESRIASVLIDPEVENGDATLVSGHGPAVTSADWDSLFQAALRQLGDGHLACVSGSFPSGTPLDAFMKLVRRLQSAGCPVWVDGSGDGLRAAIQAGAAGIKANNEEIGAILGIKIAGIVDACQAAGAIRKMGSPAVVITLGALGSILVTGKGIWVAYPPPMKRVSSVGSGDAFMGGLLLGLSEGRPLEETLQMATAAGAANTQSLGGGAFDRPSYDLVFNQVTLERLE